MIDWRDRDARGRKLSPERRAEASRLRRWQIRAKVPDSLERNLQQARDILNVLAFKMGLIQVIKERALQIYREALEKAIEAKLAEPDPTVDTHGWDPAAKLVILSNTLGYDARLENVKRVPLESVGEELVAGSLREGKRVKYVAYADFESGRLGVEPMVLEESDPLALAEGEENVIVFGLEGTGIVLRGPAGPAWRTAKVMITDILDFVQWREDTEDCPPG